MRRLMSSDEPTEWAEIRPPVFNKRPTTALDRKLNLVRYINGYPWIFVAEGKGGISRYFCGICSKAATVHHLLSFDHIEKTTIKYGEKMGYSIPPWMTRFKNIPTTGKWGHLFSYGDYDIWPDVCSECKCDVAGAQHSGCNVCRAGNPHTTGNTDRCEDSDASNDGDKRPRTASSQSADEGGRGREANFPIMRSPFQDFRERPQEPKEYEGRQFEERRNRQHRKVSDHGAHSDKGTSGHSAGDSQRALEAPRCHDELRMRAGYTHDLEKYMECHIRLFTMDHYVLPLRTVAGRLHELDSLQKLPVQVTQGHDSHGRQDRDGCRQADHHRRHATMLGYAPERRREDNQPQPPGPGQHHLGHRHKHH